MFLRLSALLQNVGGTSCRRNWCHWPVNGSTRGLLRAFTLSNALKGKTIVLAGGSGGLGAAVAESLCEVGAMPVIGYLRNRERAENFAGRLSEKYGIAVPAVAGDILDASVRQRLLEAAGKAGELYGLVPLTG